MHLRSRLISFALALTAIAVVPGLSAAVIDVPVGSDLASAVSSAEPGDELRLAKGQFTLSAEVKVEKALTIRGAGREFTRIVSDGTTHRLFTLNDPAAVLCDVTLSGAKAALKGGAVYLQQGCVRDALVRDCKTSGDGGAIAVGNGTVSRVIATGNSGRYGGAFFSDKGEVCTFENCLLFRNNASYGGGFYSESGSKTELVNCTIADNKTSGITLGLDTYDYSGAGYVHYVNSSIGVLVKNTNVKNSTFANTIDSSTAAGYASAGTGDYHPGEGSALIGAGTAVAFAKDVDGCPVPASRPAIGAFQLVTGDLPAVRAPSALVSIGSPARLTVSLPASCGVSAGTLTVFGPDDGVVASASVADGSEVSFTPDLAGAYSAVVEGADGVVCRSFRFVSAGIGAVYVDPASARPQAPYDTPETAARTLEDAMESDVLDGGTVWLLADYQATDVILLKRALTIRGAGETKKVVTPASGARLFQMMNPSATLRNLVLRGDANGVKNAGLAAQVTGGGQMVDCLVENFVCTSGNGGAVYAETGVFRAERTVFRNNRAASYGGAAYNLNTKGTMHFRNCLFYGNTAGGNWGSAIYNLGPGSMVNCTLYDNPVTPAANGEYCRDYALFGVTNCIFGSVSWYRGGAADRSHNLESPTDPGFVNAVSGDYRPTAAAVTILDRGEDAVAGADDKDLDGKARLAGDHVDLGCYEFAVGEFSAGFAVAGTATAVGDSVRLVPTVVSGKSPVNSWRVVNLAGGADIVGQTQGTGEDAAFAVTFAAPGVYSFHYSVVDGENRAKNSLLRYTTIVTTNDVYVATDGASVPPFDTPERATTNLYAAASMAGDGVTVHVGPGTFVLDARAALAHAATLEGAGPDTVVTPEPQATHGLFEVSHKDAVIRNLTMTGTFSTGFGDGNGGCVRLLSGAVEDCAVTGVVMGASIDGSAIAAIGVNGQKTPPRVSRVRITGCRGGGYGTLHLNQLAVAENVLVADCEVGLKAHYTIPYGGLVYIDGGGAFLTNCTFVGSHTNDYFNYCYLSAKPEKLTQTVNCIFDCVVSVNGTFGAVTNWFTACASKRPLPEYDGKKRGNIVVDDFRFVNAAKGDYHLKGGSPCRNVGVLTGLPLDLDRKRRPASVRPDLGCYKCTAEGFVLLVK